MCASDEALAAYRWRMKFNGRSVFTITLCVKPSFSLSLIVDCDSYSKLFFIGMNSDKATR